jgi:hypothetical protein
MGVMLRQVDDDLYRESIQRKNMNGCRCWEMTTTSKYVGGLFGGCWYLNIMIGCVHNATVRKMSGRGMS